MARWPVLYGTNPVSPDSLRVVVDEDTLFDTERSHTTEQLAFMAFDGDFVGQCRTVSANGSCVRGAQYGLDDRPAGSVLRRQDGGGGQRQLLRIGPTLGNACSECPG